jgi:hypothetical protein
MRISLTIDGTQLGGTLGEGAAARDLASLLPLALSLSDFHNAERIADLPRRLDTEGEPASAKPARGDIAYYAPWGNLALFYRDQPRADGLVILGHLDAPGEQVLAGLPEPAPLAITAAVEGED